MVCFDRCLDFIIDWWEGDLHPEAILRVKLHANVVWCQIVEHLPDVYDAISFTPSLQ